MSKLKVGTSTWRVAFNKSTEFGYYYRWYLPKFVYSMVMNDLQFIRRNSSLIYKKSGYKPKAHKGRNQYL